MENNYAGWVLFAAARIVFAVSDAARLGNPKRDLHEICVAGAETDEVVPCPPITGETELESAKIN